MIFNNLRLSDPSPELELFLWHIVGHALPKNFVFSIGGKVLKGSSFLYRLLLC